MKKFSVLLMITFCLSGISVMSQNDLYLGIGGTVQNTWITNQNNFGYTDMDYSTTFGGSGNFFIGYDFNQHIGLKMEIGYSKLGQNSKDDFNKDTSYVRKEKLYYLQIPLMFKYKTNGEVARFYFLVGPQLGLLLNARQTYLMNGDADDRFYYDLNNKRHLISEETITSHFNSLDIAARLDLGVDITLVKNLVLNAGLSLNYGLLDINASDWRIKNHDGNYDPSHNVYGGINVGLAYVFDFSKK
jgi:hypothetical protein